MSSVPRLFSCLLFLLLALSPVHAVVNKAPVLNPIGNKQAAEGSLLQFTMAASDQDKDPLVFGKNDSRGTLNESSGNFSWTPSFVESGIHFIRFFVSDGALNDSEIVIINVTESGNHAPLLDLIGGKQVLEGQLLEFSMSASDADNDLLSFSTNSSFGSLSTTGVFSWQTSFTDAGIYFVAFSVSDASETVSEIIMINITEAGNHAPSVFIIEPSGMPAGGNISVAWNSTDAENDTLSFSAYLVSRIYANASLVGENRTKICDTAQSFCFFDSSGFANGIHAVVVAANDSLNYTESYSNDFEIFNPAQEQELQMQEAAVEQPAQAKNSEQTQQVTGSSGNAIPPQFWWVSEEPVENDIQEIEQTETPQAFINDSMQFEFVPIPKAEEAKAESINEGPDSRSMYVFTGIVLLILIASVSYALLHRIASSKARGFQEFIKGRL